MPWRFLAFLGVFGGGRVNQGTSSALLSNPELHAPSGITTLNLFKIQSIVVSFPVVLHTSLARTSVHSTRNNKEV
eukprot:489386-Rhodomonas_salina.1